MAQFDITYIVGKTGPDNNSEFRTKTEQTEADSYTADDQWVVFNKLQDDGTNIVTLTIRSDKVLKIERSSYVGAALAAKKIE